MKRVSMLVLASILVVAVSVPAFAGDAAKGGKSRYLVISPHTAEQCMTTLDNIEKADAKGLAKWDFGCKDNDHTGYLVVTAASSEEALKNVPEDLRASAKAIKLTKFNAHDLKAAHAAMETSKPADADKPAESTDKK